jgi:hypothetical protein
MWLYPSPRGSGVREASKMIQHRRKPTARLQGLRAQVRDYFAPQAQRRKLFPRALLVGMLAGGIAVAFRWTLEGATSSATGYYLDISCTDLGLAPAHVRRSARCWSGG